MKHSKRRKKQKKIKMSWSFPIYVVTRIASFLCNVSDLDPHVIDRTGSPVSRENRMVSPNPFPVISAGDHHAELQRSGWCLTRAPDRTVVSCHEPPIRRTDLVEQKYFTMQVIAFLRGLISGPIFSPNLIWSSPIELIALCLVLLGSCKFLMSKDHLIYFYFLQCLGG